MFNTLLKLVPMAVEYTIDVVKRIKEGELTKDEALERLIFLAGDSEARHDRILEILESPELADAYRGFDDALGPDPSE